MTVFGKLASRQIPAKSGRAEVGRKMPKNSHRTLDLASG
jgi:hypothetical protein